MCYSLGNADRRHCKFRPDPNIPLMFSAVNEDYLGSGWSRGHMAPAGDNKFSTVGILSYFFLNCGVVSFSVRKGQVTLRSDVSCSVCCLL